MKILLYSYLIFTILFSNEIKVISYNIRYNNPNDGKDIWENRRTEIISFVFNQSPDFIGFQEVTHQQLQYLNSELSDYDFVGVGRDDGKTKGEYSPIFYNKSKFNLVKSNTFWLSETPEQISIGWDAAMERICTYALFEQINSGNKIWIFNTHFDHIGEIAREKSVDLIINKITQITNQENPIIITGDFNLSDDSNPIKKLQKSFNDVNIEMAKENKLYGTYNGFDLKSNSKKRIDYIFKKNIRLLNSSHVHLKTNFDRWASDHHPVISTFKM